MSSILFLLFTSLALKLDDNQTTVADKLTDVTSKLLDIVMLTKEVQVRGCLLISLLILTEFEGINQLLFPLKSSENLWFFEDFRVLEVN